MKILIVEDNEDSRNLLVKVIRAYGHEVMAAADGAKALEQALTQPPDIIVSDILMPKMDGFQLCRECKQNDKLKDIPFIFYTATYTADEDKKFALSLGADAFILKPTEPDILVQMLSEVFEKAKAGALAPPEVALLEPSLFLAEHDRRIFAKLDKKVAQLEAEITERKRVQEEVEHLNRVLDTIRSVNQLIIREKERDKLLNSTCAILIKTHSYDSTCICLFDESGMLVTHAEAGLGKDFLTVVERLKRGELTDCIKRTLLQSDVVITKASSLTCGDCPLVKTCSSMKVVTVRIEHGGKVYGLLRLSLSGDTSISVEEQSLLGEVTGDIAFALHNMDLEEERKRLEYNLSKRVKELECLYGIADIAERPAITLDALYQEVANLLPQAWQYPEITCSKITINGKEFRANNYRETEWNQSADIKVHGAKAGVVEVDYLEERPEIDEGPFLKEERLLINAVAERLGKITERKQAEEKIKHAAEEWRTTFDSITDLVSICDKDFKLVRVNKAFADVFEMKPAELIGKPCYEIVHGTNEPIPNCPQKVTIKTKKPATVEFFEPHLGMHLEMSTSPIFNEKGEVIACVHVIRDITKRKKMEEQLIITDRLASVGELASGIAHELNNPLTSVIGFSDLLLEKDIPDDVKEDLSVVNREAKRTAEVVQNLLIFARKHPPGKQLVNINSIIEKVLELRAYEQKVSNIQVNTQFAPDLPEVMADYFQVQQVFLNIIINAEHFMIEANNRGTLTITTERAGDIIKASFADDGPGIAKENLGHLFDPFFTTKEVGKGTGLGLSICHGIITKHGGRIYAESEFGKGATFVVELPITIDKKGTVK